MRNRNIRNIFKTNSISIDDRVQGIADGCISIAANYPRCISLIPSDLLSHALILKLLAGDTPSVAEVDDFEFACKLFVFGQLVRGEI